MNLDRRQVIFLGGVIVLVVGIGLIFLFGTRSGPGPKNKPVDLTFWGVFDDEDAYQPLIRAFKSDNKQAKITYVKINAEDYEEELINALAAGNGPDLFMIHSSWLPKHHDKLYPASAARMTVGQFEQLYPRVARSDFAPKDKVYALPLYIDTLALYYNRDLFDQAGIAVTPKSWDGFINASNRLKVIDQSTGRITRAGAAVGGSEKSVNRAGDIVTALMMQNGSMMVGTDRSSGAIDQPVSRTSGVENPGETALEFYAQFANPLAPNYTWSEAFGNSIDTFAQGTAAMMINYAHQIPILQEKNPFLSFGILPLPQADPENSVNIASYWGLAVAAKTDDPAGAWDFITFAATRPEAARLYMTETNRPPALRSLIAEKERDPILGVFVKQALTARSWPQPDNVEVDEIFSDMIEFVISGRGTVEDAVRQANSALTNAIKRSRNYKSL